MTARTWLGGGDNLASNPALWLGNGVGGGNIQGAPQPGDTLSMAGGTMNVTGNALAGDLLALTGSDAINVSETTQMLLSTSFINAPLDVTVNLQDGSNWVGTVQQTATDFGPVTVNGPGTFDNQGTSDVGDLIVNANVTGSGIFDIGSGRTRNVVEFGSGVAAGQAVVDNGSAISGRAHVQIDDPAGFHAAITMYYADAMLEGLSADSYSYENGMVSLWNGQAVVDTIRVAISDSGFQEFPSLFGVSQVAGGVDIHNNGAQASGTLLGLHVAADPAPSAPAPTDPAPAPSTPVSPAPGPMPSALPTPSAPIIPGAAPTNFTVTDTTTGAVSAQPGTPYAGPVAGLTNQIVMTSPDNLNITATTPNAFIHTGAGNDAILVNSGNNVLDGSTGSNFLTGGSGTDTFFADDRDAGAADLWSTVVGFHAGDTATIWGVTQAGFSVNWLDGQGAAGFTGLTAGFSAPGHPNANITFAGYTSADLAPGGRLAVSFGATADQPGAPGSSFMMVHGG